MIPAKRYQPDQGATMLSKYTVLSTIFGLAVLLQSCTRLQDPAEELQNQIAVHHREYLPPGVGQFPTIVMIPGCSGVAFSSPKAEAASRQLTEDDRLFRAHYPRTAHRLSLEGFAVYLIDILASEGLITACADTVPAQRIADYINESISWVKTREKVDATQIHIIGYSMGGKGTLAWLHGPRSEARSVKSVIAVYPQCRNRKPLNTAVPVLLLLGDADDIADPLLCDAWVSSSPIKGLITVHHYPGARHGFDIEGAPSVLDIGNGMTVGYQEKAANDAWQKLIGFISPGP
jgi:dienelactone hydrolase